MHLLGIRDKERVGTFRCPQCGKTWDGPEVREVESDLYCGNTGCDTLVVELSKESKEAYLSRIFSRDGVSRALNRADLVGTFKCKDCHQLCDGSVVKQRSAARGIPYYYCPRGSCEGPVERISELPRAEYEQQQQSANKALAV
jgi:hypothetical protein